MHVPPDMLTVNTQIKTIKGGWEGGTEGLRERGRARQKDRERESRKIGHEGVCVCVRVCECVSA